MTAAATPEQLSQANGVELCWQSFGSTADPAVLLVMGLGAQMIVWDERFCSQIADLGYRVIRFDNRDSGRSTHFPEGRPDMMAALSGDTSSASYSLDDMADDAAALLSTLDIDRAHVVGASMGGMIAQQLAVRHPDQVRSLTSIMSTSGDAEASRPTPEAAAVLMAPPPPDRAGAADRSVEAARVIGSTGFDIDTERIRSTALAAYDRSFDPMGTGRQLLAIYAAGNRTSGLGAVSAPTLVIHGSVDPLIPPTGGRATAAAIKGAQLMIVEGMGHDLPTGVWPQVIDAMHTLWQRADQQ